MNTKQHTVKKPVTISGVGLHTGNKVTMTFMPAPVNHGIKFQRIDLEDQPVVEADADYVVDLTRGTTLEKNGARINTVEHTLAAIVGLEIDNILIQLDAPEPPITDGSSKIFIEELQKAGLTEQDAPRNFYEIKENITYNDHERGVQIAALPHDDYRLTVMVDYNSPVLGSQHATLNVLSDFAKEIAACRTFCFLHELEMLQEHNLIKGGDLSNAIVVVDRKIENGDFKRLAKLFNKDKVAIGDEGILDNVKLRYKNEPARHKLLDMVGDLALIGRPIKGQIVAEKPGHAANIAFAKKIKKQMAKELKNDIPVYDPLKPPVMDINKITSMLPHRYPFSLIDKIIYLDTETVHGVKNVTINEPFFQGHFPGNPVMPGVLQVEAMAQTGGILVLNSVNDPENYWTYFVGIDKCRFKRMVVPGDTIVFKCHLLAPMKRGIVKMQGKAFVNGKIVSEAEMIAQIVRKDA